MSDIRLGTVSDIDTDKRIVRVKFGDKNDMVSAWLKVLSASPMITATVKTGGVPWEAAGDYVSADRKLGGNERYVKEPPDVITVERVDTDSSAKLTVRGWLPYIGQTVLCVILTNGDGDGFVIGGV